MYNTSHKQPVVGTEQWIPWAYEGQLHHNLFSWLAAFVLCYKRDTITTQNTALHQINYFLGGQTGKQDKTELCLLVTLNYFPFKYALECEAISRVNRLYHIMSDNMEEMAEGIHQQPRKFLKQNKLLLIWWHGNLHAVISGVNSSLKVPKISSINSCLPSCCGNRMSMKWSQLRVAQGSQ